MNLVPAIETVGQDDQSWLGSAHGTDMARGVTLDVSKFIAGTHYPDGYLPSGTAIALVPSASTFGPYDPADTTDSLGVLVGFTLDAVEVASGATKVVASLLEHGRVVTANLPFQSGKGSVDAAGKTDTAGRIIYI